MDEQGEEVAVTGAVEVGERQEVAVKATTNGEQAAAEARGKWRGPNDHVNFRLHYIDVVQSSGGCKCTTPMVS